MRLPCLATVRTCLICQIFLLAFSVAGQKYPVIGAENIAGLRPAQYIDFSDISDDLAIGWFEANDDASEFIVFDGGGRVYRVGEAGIIDSVAYRDDEAQIFSLIDAVYVDERSYALYLLDDAYFINDRQFRTDDFPVAIHRVDQSLFVEAITDRGATTYHEVALESDGETISAVSIIDLPRSETEYLGILIGRVDFPSVLLSSLADSVLTAYRYPEVFSSESGRVYELDGGPAVAGAINSEGSHFAWSDPASARLNLLELASGENTVVAELDGAYAQYHLLTADASAILVVNMDFRPAVFAWDVATGERYDLGAYRKCERIPDKVVISGDGKALIIGCDTGLEIWRVAEMKEE